MYDRPEVEDLLDAVIGHLTTEVVPTLKDNRKLYFQTLVANNLLKIVRRDLTYRAEHQSSEWARLNLLEKQRLPAPSEALALKKALQQRNKTLCLAIRAGDYDSSADKQTLFEHLIRSTHEQLMVANPTYLENLTEKE